MDHTEARELLEIAAVEPGGFDRLAAGDTAEASALAGHLAGCAECSAELERLRRASAVIRDAVRTTAPPDLRQRTLDFVAAVGRDRTAAAGAGAGVAVSPSVAAIQEPVAIPIAPAGRRAEAPADRAGEPVDIESARRDRRAGAGRLALWAAAIAAAVALTLVATSVLIVRPRDAQIAAQAEDVASLAKAAAWTIAIQGQPDAARVALTSTNGDADLTGTILYAPSTGHLVVLAQGLEQPPAGMEYRCWVESGGQRVPIGKMFFGGDVAYWVGKVPSVESLPADATFGVSLSPANDPTNVSAEPVLSSTAG
jgi:hypothetical protein